MSATTNAVMYALGQDQYVVVRGQVAGPAGVRATATHVASQAIQCISAAANGAFVLPSILTNEDWEMCWIINDSANAIVVSPAPNETMNGVASTANLATGILSIPAGQTGIFVPVGTTGDWRGAVLA